jgi:2-polyprenyl-6-methoxyphenol hydroxylase-like FAD-dependent oxidoreductase
VIVVGAGPTGLMLAGELAAAGVRTLVLERRSGESNLTRAFGVHARTLEQLDARGLADDLVATGSPVHELRLFDRVRLDLGTLSTRFPYLLVTPQYNVERVLRERAEAVGATIVTGAEVVGLRQDADGVDVEIDGGQRIRTRYAVGADGVHSKIREALDLPFPGVAVLKSIMLADVRLTGAPEEVLALGAVGDCFAFVAPFGDGWFRVFAWDRRSQQPESAPIEFEEVRAVTRRALGTDLGMHDPRWMSRFHSDERQVRDYRVGRVFLAGDAAHVHSPAGGQGMNTGIQDAANLGWKLAAVMHGHADVTLLDSYQTERHPVGAMVLRSSGAIIRLAMLESRPAQQVRNRVMAAALRIDAVARRVIGNVSGIGIAYPAPHGAHRLAGRRAPDVSLTTGSRLYEALRDGAFVLLGPADIAAVTAVWGSRVRVATPIKGSTPITLVRPDGYVAWASDETRAPQRDDAVRAALTNALPLSPTASAR